MSTTETTPPQASAGEGAGEGSAPPSARRRRLQPGALWQAAGPFAVFVALFALVAVLNPRFIGGGGLGILAVQSTAILLAALAQSIVLHVGSIDLSVAAMAILSAIVLALALEPLGAAAPLVVVALLALVGAVNGVLVAYAQVPSFALTLGTLGLLTAASLVLSGATTVYAAANQPLVGQLYFFTFAGLPVAFWLAVALAVLLWAVLRWTTLGQGMTAVGRGELGAVFSGLRTRRLKVVAFAVSGALSGVAGIMIIAQAGAASTFGLGSDLLLPGIAAAIVGGTAITGGVTNPINVVFGALVVALVPIGAAAVGVNPQAQSLVYGIVIIVAVALTMNRSRNRVVK